MIYKGDKITIIIKKKIMKRIKGKKGRGIEKKKGR